MKAKQADYGAMDRAFSGVSAYVIMRKGEAVGRIVVRNTQAANTAWAQIWGAQVYVAKATGYGWARQAGAIAAALLGVRDHDEPNERGKTYVDAIAALRRVPLETFREAETGAGLSGLTRALVAEGFLLQYVA